MSVSLKLLREIHSAEKPLENGASPFPIKKHILIGLLQKMDFTSFFSFSSTCRKSRRLLAEPEMVEVCAKEGGSYARFFTFHAAQALDRLQDREDASRKLFFFLDLYKRNYKEWGELTQHKTLQHILPPVAFFIGKTGDASLLLRERIGIWIGESLRTCIYSSGSEKVSSSLDSSFDFLTRSYFKELRLMHMRDRAETEDKGRYIVINGFCTRILKPEYHPLVKDFMDRGLMRNLTILKYGEYYLYSSDVKATLNN